MLKPNLTLISSYATYTHTPVITRKENDFADFLSESDMKCCRSNIFHKISNYPNIQKTLPVVVSSLKISLSFHVFTLKLKRFHYFHKIFYCCLTRVPIDCSNNFTKLS